MAASKPELPSRCDVVIIGAGMGGLTAGALLAKAGVDTVVLEAGAHPGGYLAGFQRDGYSFETAVHWLSQWGSGGFVRNIFEHIGDDIPECKPLHRVHRFKGKDYDYTLTTNPLEFRDALIRDFPEDKDGICRFFDDAKALAKRLDTLNHRVRSKETMSPIEKMVFGIKMLAWVLPVIKHIRPSVEDGLDRYFKTPALKRIFCSQERFMSVIVPVAWAFSGNFHATPRGGGATLANWLYDHCKQMGASVFFKSRVMKVHVGPDNAVSGVTCKHGHTISCSHVIAASDVHTLYNDLLPEGVIPQPVKETVNNAELHESCFGIYLGLDCSPETLGFGEEVLNLTADVQTREAHLSGDPHDSIIMVVASSVRDPSMAPEGHGCLMILTPAYMDYKDSWGTGPGLKRGDAYRAVKQEYAQIVLDRVEEMMPGLKERIVFMETSSPVTFWRYTGNTNGTIMGTKPTTANIRSNASHYRTPVKNLFIGGHCAEYGGGVPLAVKAGANSSLLVLKSMGHPEFKHLRDILG